MKTAVIYARYSSDSQTEQSIEGQLRVCQDYAKNNDILIVDTYIDRAMTGTNDMRPDFQRMIKDSITKKRLPDSIEEVERTAKQAEKSASKNKSGVYKNASTPPSL